MLRTSPRRARGPGVVLVACLVVTVVGGCGRLVAGSGSAAAGVQATIPAALTELLIDPQRLPDSYPATELDAAAVDGAVRAIDGVPAAAVVDPPECAPPPTGAPRDAVAVRGVDPATSHSLTVALTRTDIPLGERRGQWADCSSFSYTVDGATYRVAATLLPEPPVDADGAYALELTISGASDVERRLALVAQIADVRVAAAWAGGADAAADSTALDVTFRNAVLQVRRAGPR